MAGDVKFPDGGACSVPKWFLVHDKKLDHSYNTTTFFNAVTIWLERPQVLNRRLAGSYMLQSFRTNESQENMLSSIYKLSEKSEPLPRDELLQLKDNCETTVENKTGWNQDMLHVKIRTLLPRQSNKYKNVLEVIVQDKKNNRVIFIPFEDDQSADQIVPKVEHAYQVSLKNKSLILSVLAQRKVGDGITCPTVEWLKSHLLPKLHKWMQEDGTIVKSLGSSLRLVPVDRYSQKYEELKKKYKHFVKMWPERTDPHKFVYEDVAIATYLLLLWENTQDKEGKKGKIQRFVDLGCGNGLLVHILANEGHLGKGIDLRARKVWKLYDCKTDLQICSLDPSSVTYSDADWLIGNHSDELTPWIPVIAAKSSYYCKYFLLPCCFHDFYCKYQREKSNECQYRSYLNYVQSVSQMCGFQVEEDILRIPSTKRICHVGQVRTYLQSEQDSTEKNITTMLQNARYNFVGMRNRSDAETEHTTIGTCEKGPLELQNDFAPKQSYDSDSTTQHNTGYDSTGKQAHLCKNEHQPTTDSETCKGCISLSQHTTEAQEGQPVLKSFVPRPDKEPIRNCTQLDKSLLDDIIQRVATELLARPKVSGSGKGNGKTWNKGGCIWLSEVPQLFNQDVLTRLRSEAGGIKTVLRNSHQVFKVQGGMVELRDWQKESHNASCTNKAGKTQHSGTKKYWKTKQCWFYNNHPDGCPLPDHECSFAHGTNDIKILL